MSAPVRAVRRIALAAGAFPALAFAQNPAASCATAATRVAPAPALPATIPVEIRNNHVQIPVCRGATPLTFTLDTGAPYSIFDLTLARQFGIGILSTYRANGGGPGSSAAARTARDSVFIPGASITVPVSNAIDFASLSASGGALQGIIGADFLNQYVVAIDYAAKELRVFDRATFKYDGRGTTVPFTFRGPYIFVEGELGLGDGSRVPGTFVVDVGSSLPLALARPFVDEHHLRDRVGPTIRRPGGRGVGGVSMADVGRIQELRVGGVSLSRPIVNMPWDSSGVFATRTLGDGNIGADILRRFTVYLDYSRQRLIFEPNAAMAEPFEADMSGLQIVASGSSFAIDYIVDKSPAAEAGLARGDTIVAVDGQTAAGMRLDDLRLKLRREGQTVAFTVRRGGETRTFTLVTRRLV